MSAKHTPGPWRPVHDAQGICGLMHPEKNGVAVAWFSTGHVPANGFVGEAIPGTGRAGRPERQANVYLIAAAPEMLEALKDCIEHMEWSTPEGRAAYEKASAAIAKAEGRS